MDGTAVHPLVVCLDAPAIAAPDLPARLDALFARGLPLVFCPGFPDLPRPQTGHRPTQRRIDLLALEQAAWTLAARDPRCVVVSSRTEIDWALRRGQSVVWAPSKIVLDAVDGPRSADPVALALWLAEELAAQALVLHGDVAIPAGSRVTVERR
jgi:7,8-dihydroneopterin aldolase/epimerase/oxygenase